MNNVYEGMISTGLYEAIASVALCALVVMQTIQLGLITFYIGYRTTRGRA